MIMIALFIIKLLELSHLHILPVPSIKVQMSVTLMSDCPILVNKFEILECSLFQ